MVQSSLVENTKLWYYKTDEYENKNFYSSTAHPKGSTKLGRPDGDGNEQIDAEQSFAMEFGQTSDWTKLIAHVIQSKISEKVMDQENKTDVYENKHLYESIAQLVTDENE